MITITAGSWPSITVDPSLGFARYDGTTTGFGGARVIVKVSVNRGTSFNNRPSCSVI